MAKAKVKPNWKVVEKPRQIRIPKPKVKSRKEQAKEVACSFHAPGDETQAEEFCGAWLNNGDGGVGAGQECHAPLCSNCADIRLQIWLCPVHSGKEDAK